MMVLGTNLEHARTPDVEWLQREIDAECFREHFEGNLEVFRRLGCGDDFPYTIYSDAGCIVHRPGRMTLACRGDSAEEIERGCWETFLAGGSAQRARLDE